MDNQSGEEHLIYITDPNGDDITTSSYTIKNSCTGTTTTQLGIDLNLADNEIDGSIDSTEWKVTDVTGDIKIDKTGELTITGIGSATVTANVYYQYIDSTSIPEIQNTVCDCSICNPDATCEDTKDNECDLDTTTDEFTSPGINCVKSKSTLTPEPGQHSTASFNLIVTAPVTGVSIGNIPYEDIGLDSTITLTVTVTPLCADTTVTWESSNNEAVTVTSDGIVNAVGCGTATITAYSTEDKNVKGSCSVTVQPVSGVTISPSSTKIKKNDTYQLSTIVTPSYACDTDVTWKSSNNSVASVSSDGVVTANSCGSTTITATTDNEGKTATCEVTVSVPITSITLNYTVDSLDLTGSNTIQLMSSVTPSDTCNDLITWSSSNSNVAKVDDNGLVTSVSCGTATIMATSQVDNKTATCAIAVIQPATGITLSDSLISLRVTKTDQLFDTIHPLNACNKNVTWSSSDSTVVKVDSSGVITALRLDTALITAKTVDGGYTASCKVIGELLVTLNQTSVTLNVKDTITLIATITPASISNKTVSWKSYNPSIATVDSSGNVSAISGGTTYIIARSNANNKVSASCVVNVRPQIKNIIIQNSENQPNTDFIAGRGSIITITGSGFGNTQLFNSNKGYVSFTNADQGGLVSSYLIDKNSHRKTSMIDDYDSCDYTTPNGNVWSDSLIQMYLPSTIYANNIIINDTIQPEGIGSGHVTVTNNAIITDSSNYQITIPHAYIAVFSRKLKNKYPILLKNNTFTYTYGPGLANFDPKGITLINRAMKEWSCRNNINDTLVRTSSNSTDTIYFAPLSNSSALASTQIIQGNLYSDGYYYPSSTRITINTLYTSNNSQYKFNYKLPDNNIGTDSFDFYHVILHELGHALGLAHINDSLSLMYYSTPPGLKYNQRIDLRNKAGEPENYTDQTNAVQDANFIVTTSEQSLITGKLAPFTPGNCGPLAPSGLIAAVKSAGNINLRWTSASDMDYYTLTRTDLFGNQVQLYITDGAPIGAGTAIYRDLSVSPGATYTYNLTSINSFGYASTITQSISTPLLAKPGIIQTSATTSNNVTISWTGNANTYTILRSSDEGQTYETIATGDTTTTYTDNTVTPGATYTYKVQGNITNTLKESDPVTVTACLAIISKTTYSSSTIIYPCNNSIEFINDTIKNNSNVRVNGSSNKVNIQGKFQVQKGSSFYAK